MSHLRQLHEADPRAVFYRATLAKYEIRTSVWDSSVCPLILSARWLKESATLLSLEVCIFLALIVSKTIWRLVRIFSPTVVHYHSYITSRTNRPYTRQLNSRRGSSSWWRTCRARGAWAPATRSRARSPSRACPGASASLSSVVMSSWPSSSSTPATRGSARPRWARASDAGVPHYPGQPSSTWCTRWTPGRFATSGCNSSQVSYEIGDSWLYYHA